MEEKLRKSGIDIIGDLPWGTHFCQLYHTKEDLVDILVPYFKAGLENNEFCLWITPPHLEVEEAAEALREVIPDVDIYLEKGQIEITSCTYLHLNGSIYDSEGIINGWIEKFNNREDIKDSEVLEAFRESQDRVISMALIHEELYKGGGLDTLNFSPYIEELAGNLFQTYKLGNTDISLNMDLEENIFFDMDTAVPLGMIVNELVSNSFKHAFPGKYGGEIRIKLRREERGEIIYSTEEGKNESCNNTNYTLTVSDNGVGIPEKLNIEDLDTLGFQLVASLADQLDGEFKLNRNNGTEFSMQFAVKKKNGSSLF